MSVKFKIKSPAYVMLSSDYSQQEPKITAFVSQDPNMIKSFQEGKDIYATIASIAFQVPYEKCLEFHPETHEYQPDGKARRGEAKTIVLGICYGRSVVTIGEQLYGTDDALSSEDKTKKAQFVYDAVLKAFPNLRNLMVTSQAKAAKLGYTETILGRRRHIPDMMLDEFEFKAMPGYVNPDIDPLDVATLANSADIPDRIVAKLKQEFSKYKYFGQIVKRTKELAEQKIKVINNRSKITDATRQCVNCVDFDTEILSTAGWKQYDQVRIGDRILSFNLDSQRIEEDVVRDIHVSNKRTEVINFETPTFSASSTLNHRWIVCDSGQPARIKYTHNIYKNRWPDYPILRVEDNELSSSCNYSDDQLKLLGWILTDGCFSKKLYGIEIYQSTNTAKNLGIYQNMIATLDKLGMQYNDTCSDGIYHSIYINKNEWSAEVFKRFPERNLTWDFVTSLSQLQCEILMWAMIEGGGTLGDNGSNITFTCSSECRRDIFQYLAFRAGYATNSYTITADQANAWSSDKMYDSVSNSSPIHVKSNYYTITVLRVKRAHICPHHKSKSYVSGVWCVTTNNGTWVARRHGKVYITGNSIVQGSAADMTKMAILNLESNEEWKRIGGRLLLPVHDELICEVPIDKWEEGGELLSKLMSDAGDFLPFPINCDVETSLRWYGLSYPCPYEKPSSMDNLSEDNIKWLQYHILENEVILPVFKDENGEKPRGDAAKGVNGKFTDELQAAIDQYKAEYDLDDDTFIDHIEQKVQFGLIS